MRVCQLAQSVELTVIQTPAVNSAENKMNSSSFQYISSDIRSIILIIYYNRRPDLFVIPSFCLSFHYSNWV